MTVHLLPMTIQETLYIGSFIVTSIDCDNTFFLISLFKMRHVIFSLNEYVMLCYVMLVDFYCRLTMAYHFTSSRAQRPSEIECSDVQPSDVAPVAATSSSTFVGPSVAAVGGPESMATEPAESVSVLIHPSPAGRPSFQGGLGVPGPAGPPRVGDSMGYPSGLAGPSVMSTHSREQLSSSGIATVVDTTPASSASVAAAAHRRRDGCRWRSYNIA